MTYHSVVCVKQVPDTNAITGNPMKGDGTVNRAALPAITNPDDMQALEAALEIRDQHGGTVSVVTMGPSQAGKVLREAMYRGADEAFLITDNRAVGSDTLATSYVLSCAVKKLKPDLVFCGRRTIDGDNAQVGPQLAEQAGLTPITYVNSRIVIEKRSVTARRGLDTGCDMANFLTDNEDILFHFDRGDLAAAVAIMEGRFRSVIKKCLAVQVTIRLGSPAWLYSR